MERKADVVCSVNVNLSAVGVWEEMKLVTGWWEKTVESLRVVDWMLFGDDP